MLPDTTITPIVDRPQASGDAEAAFMASDDLPVGWIAGFQVKPDRFMFAYRPDLLDHQGAVEIARLMIGNFRDITAEAMAEVTA